ncbi:hypothetical protein BurMR1_3061 [Burkholderia sp. MR1]|nr:hypothetical protein BurMR1_3061 [Burkholderia sp. MR1]
MTTADDDKKKPAVAGRYNLFSTGALQKLGKGHHLSFNEFHDFLAFAGEKFCSFLNDQQVGELMLAWEYVARASKVAEKIQASEAELAAGDDADQLTKRLLLAAADHLRR